MHFYTSYTTDRNIIDTRESLNVDLAKRSLAMDISSVVNDLMFLAKHVEAQEFSDELTHTDKKQIAKEFRVFSQEKTL